MSKGLQAPGITYYDHGVMVNNFYLSILNNEGAAKLPDGFGCYLEKHKAFLELHHHDICVYQIYHDVSKIFCRTQIDGKVHYPDHAELSAKIWEFNKGSLFIAELMRRDMDFHLMKNGSDYERYDRKDLTPILFCTAIAELNANANMFGGYESDSFKIKFKRLCKIFKSILNRSE